MVRLSADIPDDRYQTKLERLHSLVVYQLAELFIMLVDVIVAGSIRHNLKHNETPTDPHIQRFC